MSDAPHDAEATLVQMRDALDRDDLSAREELARAIGEWAIVGKQLHDALVSAETRLAAAEARIAELTQALHEFGLRSALTAALKG